MIPTVALPPGTPSTDQDTALPAGAVAENCEGCPGVKPTAVGVTITTPLMIVTLAVLLFPPAPLQMSE